MAQNKVYGSPVDTIQRRRTRPMILQPELTLPHSRFPSISLDPCADSLCASCRSHPTSHWAIRQVTPHDVTPLRTRDLPISSSPLRSFHAPIDWVFSCRAFSFLERTNDLVRFWKCFSIQLYSSGLLINKLRPPLATLFAFRTHGVTCWLSSLLPTDKTFCDRLGHGWLKPTHTHRRCCSTGWMVFCCCKICMHSTSTVRSDKKDKDYRKLLA
jgi:hypothetical protein